MRITFAAQVKGDVEVENEGSFVNSYTGSTLVHSIFSGYLLSDGFEIYGGINNLTDELLNSAFISIPANSMGRMLFFGAKAEF